MVVRLSNAMRKMKGENRELREARDRALARIGELSISNLEQLERNSELNNSLSEHQLSVQNLQDELAQVKQKHETAQDVLNSQRRCEESRVEAEGSRGEKSTSGSEQRIGDLKKRRFQNTSPQPGILDCT